MQPLLQTTSSLLVGRWAMLRMELNTDSNTKRGDDEEKRRRHDQKGTEKEGERKDVTEKLKECDTGLRGVLPSQGETHTKVLQERDKDAKERRCDARPQTMYTLFCADARTQ